MSNPARLSIGAASLWMTLVGCGSERTSVPSGTIEPVVAAERSTPSMEPEPAVSPRTAEDLSEWRVQPQAVVLAPDDVAIQLRAEQTGPEGTVLDRTADVAWDVDAAEIVQVERGGYARPRKPGKALIRASLHGQRIGEVTVEVEHPKDEGRPWDFATDIVPIFTRRDCNSGGCHGRADGQNGFHLSLFGYDPERDFEALTRQAGGRRLDRLSPPASLLLRKATGQAAHAGGVRLTPSSDDYRTLASWIAAGAPRRHGEVHGSVVAVRVEPSEIWLNSPASHQLRVVARHADGHERDVTRLSKFRTNDETVATVDVNGRAALLQRSETDLVIRFQSAVIPVRIAAPVNPDLALDFASLPRRNVIDEKWLERLERLKVPPSPPAPDAAFLRRVSLDLTGQLPRPDEIRAYLADRDPDKPLKKVDELMGRREFLHFWAIKLGDLLQITSNRFPGAGYFQMWLQQRLGENAPWDEMVVELLTATGNPSVKEGGAANYALDGPDPQSRAESTAQRFLGIRMRCAQCHDHPFDVWTQDDYYGLAAFFAKVQYGNPMMPGGMMMTAEPMVTINPEGQILHKRTGEPAEPRLLDGTSVALASAEDPRQALAAWMTRPDNPYFARAAANWVWAQFFDRGLADPADDLSAANPPVHPELLDAMASSFVESGFDLRTLIRLVATSHAYAASSAPTTGNESDHRLFSHQSARPLTAHQMADALAHATDVPNRYPNRGPKTKAIEIFDPATPSSILDTFGRCDRTTSCSATAATPLSLRQSLLLIGGDVIDSKVASLDGYLANSLEYGVEVSDLIESLYLRTLCRFPTAEERANWIDELESAPSLREATEDLFWALLNSREFAFNH